MESCQLSQILMDVHKKATKILTRSLLFVDIKVDKYEVDKDNCIAKCATNPAQAAINMCYLAAPLMNNQIDFYFMRA